jgi:AcrR family transcriptional regulator
MDRRREPEPDRAPGALFPPPRRVVDLRKAPLTDADARSVLGRAAVEVAGEVGYADLIVDRVIEHAGISRPVFYRLFEDRGAAYAHGYAELAPVLVDRLLADCRGSGSWREGLAAALGRLVDFLAAEPPLAAGLIAEVHGAGAPAMALREAAIASLTGALREASLEAPEIEPPPSAGAFVVAAIETATIQALTRTGPEDLRRKLPGLEYIAVATFLGTEAAQEEFPG